jgi:hypothetical protein
MDSINQKLTKIQELKVTIEELKEKEKIYKQQYIQLNQTIINAKISKVPRVFIIISTADGPHKIVGFCYTYEDTKIMTLGHPNHYRIEVSKLTQDIMTKTCWLNSEMNKNLNNDNEVKGLLRQLEAKEKEITDAFIKVNQFNTQIDKIQEDIKNIICENYQYIYFVEKWVNNAFGILHKSVILEEAEALKKPNEVIRVEESKNYHITHLLEIVQKVKL